MDHVSPAIERRWSLRGLVPSTPAGFLIATGLIVLGFLPLPGDWLLLSSVPSGTPAWLLLPAVVQVIALVPFGLALLGAIVGLRLPARPLQVLAWLVLPVGLFSSLFLAAFSGPAVEIVLLGGVLTMMAVVGTLLWLGREGLKPSGRILVGMAVLIPAIVAVWSLASIGVVLASVHRVANGAPFCLARHGSHTTQVESIWELRWFSFYTTNTGYKSTSSDYFHGLLAVETPEGNKTYNWSPRRMRFDLVRHPERFRSIGVKYPCTASPRFWQSLRVKFWEP